MTIPQEMVRRSLFCLLRQGRCTWFQIFDDFRVADAIVSNESEQTISGSLNVTGGINVGIQSAGTKSPLVLSLRLTS